MFAGLLLMLATFTLCPVEKYGIKGILLDRFVDANPIVNILNRHPGWKLTYMDEGSLIFLPAEKH